MKHTNIYAADFETSVYKGQKKTEVWSSAFCPIRTPNMLKRGDGKDPDYDDVKVFHSIEETVDWMVEQNRDLIVYYHNLKFDGTFWIDWLNRNGIHYAKKSKKKEFRQPMTYDVLISNKGMWYSIDVTLSNGHVIRMMDSLKIIPFSLKKAGKDFGTKHQKLEMEYTGKRYPGCNISDTEMKYIKNDVLVLAELVETMYREAGIDQHTMTIGSACMKFYKQTISVDYWNETFWRLDQIGVPDGNWGITNKRVQGENGTVISVEAPVENADSYIRKSYRGGWCYAKDDKTGKVYTTKNRVKFKKAGDVMQRYYIGLTADVNSLY